jgi:hypothetical protein
VSLKDELTVKETARMSKKRHNIRDEKENDSDDGSRVTRAKSFENLKSKNSGRAPQHHREKAYTFINIEDSN